MISDKYEEKTDISYFAPSPPLTICVFSVNYLSHFLAGWLAVHGPPWLSSRSHVSHVRRHLLPVTKPPGLPQMPQMLQDPSSELLRTNLTLWRVNEWRWNWTLLANDAGTCESHTGKNWEIRGFMVSTGPPLQMRSCPRPLLVAGPCFIPLTPILRNPLLVPLPPTIKKAAKKCSSLRFDSPQARRPHGGAWHQLFPTSCLNVWCSNMLQIVHKQWIFLNYIESRT